MLLALALVVVVGGMGAIVIWRMERSRRRVLDLRIEGVVTEKRETPERAEGMLPSRGVGAGGIQIVPHSFVLEIRTASETRSIVVDAVTFGRYEVGDAYPAADSRP